MVVFAHLSDIHIGGDERNAVRVERVMGYLNNLAEPVDAVLVTGDIDSHPHVSAILCGHAHTAAASTFAGRPVRVAPSTASTLRLPWEHGDLFDREAPPAVAFHVLDDAGRLTTHFRVVP